MNWVLSLIGASSYLLEEKRAFEINLDSYLKSYPLTQKDHRPNIKAKAIELPEDNTEIYIHRLGVGRDF